MIKVAKNVDITTIERGVLLNGVNCQRAMGSGVAKAYFTKWPIVRESYMSWFKHEMVLGKFDPVRIIPDQLYVANCWTQEFYGSDGKKYADLAAILASVEQAALFAKRKGLDIYTPWIGCGLGGLDKESVLTMLEIVNETTGVEITVCEFE